jgi:hypothetical protein
VQQPRPARRAERGRRNSIPIDPSERPKRTWLSARAPRISDISASGCVDFPDCCVHSCRCRSVCYCQQTYKVMRASSACRPAVVPRRRYMAVKDRWFVNVLVAAVANGADSRKVMGVRATTRATHFTPRSQLYAGRSFADPDAICMSSVAHRFRCCAGLAGFRGRRRYALPECGGLRVRVVAAARRKQEGVRVGGSPSSRSSVIQIE